MSNLSRNRHSQSRVFVEVQSAKSKIFSDLYKRIVEGMNKDQQKKVARLLNKYSSVFSGNDNDIGRTRVFKHRFPTRDVQPIKDDTDR